MAMGKTAIKTILATPQLLRNILLAAMICLSVSACETSEINTRYATTWPIRVGGVLVVYELGNLDKNMVPPPSVPGVPPRVQARMAESLGKAVEQLLPSGLESQGIHSSFVLRSDDNAKRELPPDGSGITHEVRIRAFKDTQVCREAGMCAHQLTVRVSVVRTGSEAVLWSTEIQEPSIQPLIIEQQRFTMLAEHIFNAVAHVLRPAT
jgi:hypothetical protein